MDVWTIAALWGAAQVVGTVLSLAIVSINRDDREAVLPPDTGEPIPQSWR